MADTITLPGGKKVNRWMFLAIAAGGSVAAYAVWKNHQNAASVSSSTDASGEVTDPASGISYPADAQDPVTGETYSQEIGQYGSVEAADQAAQDGAASYLQNSGDLYGTGYAGSEYNTGTYGATTTTSGSVYTSNSAWAQAATAGLTDIGYVGTDVSAALGLYLTGAPVTSEQAAIINAAIAEYGAPPVGTFTVTLLPSGNTGTTNPPPSGGTTVTKPATPTGVHATPYATFIDVAWNPVSGATSYDCHATYQESASGGAGVYPGVVSGTHATIKGLAPNRTYTLHVSASNSAGSSPETNGPAVKTPAK